MGTVVPDSSAVIALTRNASRLACSIAVQLEADLYLKPEFRPKTGEFGGGGKLHLLTHDFGKAVGELFAGYDALVFVMACGIVVRSIADHLGNKRTDPAVVVVDEAGHFSISLLSGHEGGANALARKVAEGTGGQAVITTATDVNGMPAFDELARKNGCVLENPEVVKLISSCLVNGGSVGFHTDHFSSREAPKNVRVLPFPPSPEDPTAESASGKVVLANRIFTLPGSPTLIIRPKNLVLGFGCRKGVSAEAISSAVMEFLAKHGYSPLSLHSVGTIALKEFEPGLRALCAQWKLDLRIIAAERIREVQDQFASSEFVRSVTGLGAVAEPAAVLAGCQARLVVGKTKINGLSLALAEEERRYLW